jgi:hypothetical protein
MELLNDEDREHLQKEAESATIEEKWGMLQQVRRGCTAKRLIINLIGGQA